MLHAYLLKQKRPEKVSLKLPPSPSLIPVDVRPMGEIMQTYGRPIDAYVDGEPARCTDEYVKYVPLDDVLSGEWLDFEDDDFEVEYNFEKPKAGEGLPIAFICRGGVRSKMAMEAAREKGIEAVNFLPGAEGWSQYFEEWVPEVN
ncbi:hypothetical protein TrLO_g256 [Triparma laevis f. longispina]|nr:hypothetical protein TrLO_g256 [Triparma laevis f. longispina]